MRIIRLVIISFIFFFILATGFSLLIPSKVRVSKAVNIKAGRDSIMAVVKDPSRWKEWYPGLDTAKMLLTDGVVTGVILEGTDAKKSSYIKLVSSDSAMVEASLISSKMKPVSTVWRTVNYPSTDSITLQWYMEFHFRWYPWEKFASLLLEKSYGASMEKGLNQLKKNVEN